MKTLIPALALILSAFAAMAEAPCQNPVVPACEKACAVMGAKYILWIRGRDLPAGAQLQTVSTDSQDALASAQHLASFAGLSLDYIDGLPMQQVKQAIAAYCPR
jgi:hypothetical protein